MEEERSDPGAADRRTVLFVYGTLKRGWDLAVHLDGQAFLGFARTTARYRLHHLGGYPGLVEAEPPGSGRSIEGELWSVDAACLARLDEIEGVDEGEYERRSIELLDPWSAHPAEAYHYLGDVSDLPDCGERW